MTVLRPAARFNAPWLFPVVAFVAVVLVLAGIVALSSRIGANDLPPEAPAFTPPPSLGLPPRYTVKQATGGTVSVLEDAVAGQGAPGSRELSPARAWPVLLLMGLSIQFPFYEAIIQTEALAMAAERMQFAPALGRHAA